MLYLVLRLVHFIAMATWFGMGLLAVSDIKRSLRAGPAHYGPLRERMTKLGRYVGISGALTILSGVALVFMLGGFGSVPVAIHIGLVTAVLTGAVGGVGVGGTWTRIDKQLESGASAESVQPLVKRIVAFSGVFQLLWLVTLALMVFRSMI